MKKNIIIFAHWLAGSLGRLVAWLNSLGRVEGTESNFVDLAPRDDADQRGVYTNALRFATNNERVSNIALTGPYGSGKSSIIQTFLKTYPRPALHISLAAFVHESNADDSTVDDSPATPKQEKHKVSRQEIERSILQQMLYGADANKLPLSRFKRIQSPSRAKSILVALYLLLSFLALWHVFDQKELSIADLLSNLFTLMTLENWLNSVSILLALLFLGVVLHKLYVASFGVSLKSISLKDIEMRPSSEDQESILNRHLDEIIYFFQSTTYDLVVIEDLDRFDNPDIFVSLREINSLINENVGIRREQNIKFLYALRDDMFANIERTKFFEFIIPVIPIINTSNSIDMVLEESKRLVVDGQLDKQFLKEVSRYLNDLRLIRNIFNEFSIYVDSLVTDGKNFLDRNKLLAILIYKNVCPRDFEDLHRGQGILYNVLNCHDELIEPIENKYRTELNEIKNQLEVAEQQTPRDLKELRQIYAMSFAEKLPSNTYSISFDNNTWITFSELTESELFEQVMGTYKIFYRKFDRYGHKQNTSIFEDASKFLKAYQKRKLENEVKLVESKGKSLRQINEFRSKIAALRTTKLKELLRLELKDEKDRFKGFGENIELARFLILEGHLDDTYYLYTSLFHSGRLSPNDHKFLIKIRAYSTPAPDFQIDNPKDVVREMRKEDFRQSYVLNVTLVDCLLSNQSDFHTETRKLLGFLSTEFKSCEEFFDAYYVNGCEVERLLAVLSSDWDGLVPAAIGSSKSINHITQLISKLPEAQLKNLVKDFDELGKFVSENLPQILAYLPEIEPERFKWINFQVKDLDAIKDHLEIARFMFEQGLFEINIRNLEFAYQVVLGESDLGSLRKSNFTTIRSIDSKILLDRIERDFDVYLSQVLLELEENTKEDVHAILDIVCRVTQLNQDILYVFLERQSSRLPNLDGVPEELHAKLFQLGKIEPAWVNCLEFINGDTFDEVSLIGYFEQDDISNTLLKHPIPIDGDFLKLRQFIFNADSLSDSSYKEYARALPKQFPIFPENYKPAKWKSLIEENKITFTEEAVETLDGNRELQALFVEKNIDIYLKNPEVYRIDDDLREVLLESKIDDSSKCRVIELMNLDALADLTERSELIGQIISKNNDYDFDLNAGVVKSLMSNIQSTNTRILILNNYHDSLSIDEVREVLNILPKPYSEIKAGHKQPKLSNSLENKNLVTWLESREIISSWKIGGKTNDYIKIHLFKDL